MSNDSPCISEGDDYESNYITDADSDSDLQHLTHREPSSPTISLEEAIGLVREGYYALVVWNGCYGGGPHFSKEGSKLYETLGKEGFDLDEDVILMEVLKRLGPEKATGPCSAFMLGLIEKRCEKYIERSEYDGFESVEFDDKRYVADKLMDYLDRKGAITRDKYLEMLEEAASIEITGVLIGYSMFRN